jgi:hypothetical protein
VVADEWGGSGSEEVGMIEPMYVYKKGHGWVPQIEDIASVEIGLWRVTVIIKTPEIGDMVCYASQDQTAEEITKLIVANSTSIFYSERLDRDLTRYGGANVFTDLCYRPIYLERL